MTGHAQALVDRLLFPDELIEWQHKATIKAIPGLTRKYRATLYLTRYRLMIADIDGARNKIISFAFWAEIKEPPSLFNDGRLTTLAISAPGRALPLVRVDDSVAVTVAALWQQRQSLPVPQLEAHGLVEPSRRDTALYPGRCAGCGWHTRTLESCSACGRRLNWPSPVDYLSYASEHPEFVFGPAVTAGTDTAASKTLRLIVNHAVTAYGEGQPHFAFGLAEWISAVREHRTVDPGAFLNFPAIAPYLEANDAHTGWIRLRGLPTTATP